MRRYKLTTATGGRRPWYRSGGQSVSLVLHLLLLYVLSGFTTAVVPTPQRDVLHVTLKESSPTPDKTRETAMKSAKIKAKAKTSKRTAGVKTGRPLPPRGRRKAELADAPRSGPTPAARPERIDRLARLLEVTPDLTTRSAPTEEARARTAEIAAPRRDATLNSPAMPMGGSRRLADLSSRLNIGATESPAGGGRQAGRDLELALIADSSYTILPEFRWGPPEIRYPLWARKRGSEGSVALVIDILETGDVGMARCAETPLDPELGDFLVREASNWKFKPVYRDGLALSGTVAVRVHYVLQNQTVTTAVVPVQ